MTGNRIQANSMSVCKSVAFWNVQKRALPGRYAFLPHFSVLPARWNREKPNNTIRPVPVAALSGANVLIAWSLRVEEIGFVKLKKKQTTVSSREAVVLTWRPYTASHERTVKQLLFHVTLRMASKLKQRHFLIKPEFTVLWCRFYWTSFLCVWTKTKAVFHTGPSHVLVYLTTLYQVPSV